MCLKKNKLFKSFDPYIRIIHPRFLSFTDFVPLEVGLSLSGHVKSPIIKKYIDAE